MEIAEALELDRRGIYDKAVAPCLEQATGDNPADPELAARVVNFYFARGQVDAATRVLETSLAAAGTLTAAEVNTLLLPAAACGLTHAEHAFARSALDAVPERLRNGSWRAMNLEWNKWYEIEGYGNYVSWDRAATAWWEAPAVLPRVYQGKELLEWMAGKVSEDGIIDGEVNIEVAMCGHPDHPTLKKGSHGHTDRPATGWTRITKDEWRRVADYPLPQACSYLEIGAYFPPGEGKDGASTMIIRDTPATTDRRILTPYPKLRRYQDNSSFFATQ